MGDMGLRVRMKELSLVRIGGYKRRLPKFILSDMVHLAITFCRGHGSDCSALRDYYDITQKTAREVTNRGSYTCSRSPDTEVQA